MSYLCKMKICGIYKIINKADERAYVGYSSDIEGRIKHHFNELNRKAHANYYLQKAFICFGMVNFTYVILEECSVDLLVSREDYWAKILQVHNREYGYNIEPTCVDRKYKTMAEESRTKLSKTLTGRKIPKEQVDKIRKSVAKVIEDRGYWMTEEGKASISKARKGVNNRPGYTHSEETKKKISKNNIGKTHTKETKEHLRKVGMGKSNAKGKRSPESIEKIRQGALKGWENRKNKQK